MSHIKRILSAMLAALIITGAAACSTGTQTDKTESGDKGTSDESVLKTEEETLGDDLPDADFDGRDFRVGLRTPAEYEIFTELSGEVTDDAVFNRNARISERFNTEIVPVPISDDPLACYNDLTKNVLAGEDAYDLFGCYVYLLYNSATAKVLSNWIDVEHINMEKPWWNKTINDGATINGILYGLTGTLAITYMQYVDAIFFNIETAEEYGLTQEVLYGFVSDGTWTVDKLAECVKPMYKDINGDSKRDDGDRYGIGVSKPLSFDIWPTAFEIPITEKDGDGKINITLVSDKTVSALKKIISLFDDNPGGYIYDKGDSLNDTKFFIDGDIVFLPTYLLEAFNNLREMKTAYGIMPVPKWDEAQSEYHSLVADGYTIWQLPKTVTDTDFVGTITEALAADTYNNVYPVFYDVAMKNKYSEDEATAKMVDLIVGSASFDFSFMYGIYLEYLPYQFRQLVIAGKSDIVSQYKSMEKKANTKLEQLYELYQ